MPGDVPSSLGAEVPRFVEVAEGLLPPRGLPLVEAVDAFLAFALARCFQHPLVVFPALLVREALAPELQMARSSELSSMALQDVAAAVGSAP